MRRTVGVVRLDAVVAARRLPLEETRGVDLLELGPADDRGRRGIRSPHPHTAVVYAEEPVGVGMLPAQQALDVITDWCSSGCRALDHQGLSPLLDTAAKEPGKGGLRYPYPIGPVMPLVLDLVHRLVDLERCQHQLRRLTAR